MSGCRDVGVVEIVYLIGMNVFGVIACESLNICTVCIWRC